MKQEVVFTFNKEQILLEQNRAVRDIQMVFPAGAVQLVLGGNNTGKSRLLAEIYAARRRYNFEKQRFEHATTFLHAGPVIFHEMTGIDFIRFYVCADQLDQAIVLARALGLRPEQQLATCCSAHQYLVQLVLSVFDDNPLVLIDDPLRNLDRKGIETFISIIRNLKRQRKSILLASVHHPDLPELADACYELAPSGDNIRLKQTGRLATVS